MKYEKASLEDLSEVIALYNNCKSYLLKNGIYQWGEWGDYYPNSEYLRNSILDKEMFVLKNGSKIIGAVILDEKQSKEWENIDWINSDGKTLVIHALVIDPIHQNKGFGKVLLLFCEQYAKDNKYLSIRLDSFKKNDISNRLYQSNGYKNLGTVIFDMKPENNKEYYCYEKIL
jgi:GNAT superfamily N-acetyltransferase